ncbi:hypothetical protein AK812_SmicGene3600 [Symbiodinium microadriaticum]|uniref:Uncharacterized protein n=1 Tax=Symbiodinium microadriaticum TaxID=2951 RepID=A0A1Q9EYM5_SYMMI|nr:hypothetical protein AK812_SmicGene3600 [Symbiodinium microadriaticum]
MLSTWTSRTRRFPSRPCRPLTQPPSETPVSGLAWPKVADSFLELLVYSTLWMSFSLASLVPFVQLECGSAIDWPLGRSSCVFIRARRDASKGATKIGVHKSPRSGMDLHRFKTVLGGGHVGLCAAYAKLKPHMPYCKAFYVSFCVLFMAIAAPCAYAPGLLSSLGRASLCQLLLLIFSVALTVEQLQDIRDVDEDLEAQVVTLPTGLGARRARQLLLTFQVVSLAVHLLVMRLAHLPLRPHFLGVHAACSVCAVAFTQRTPRSLFQVLLEPLYAFPLFITLHFQDPFVKVLRNNGSGHLGWLSLPSQFEQFCELHLLEIGDPSPRCAPRGSSC